MKRDVVLNLSAIVIGLLIGLLINTTQRVSSLEKAVATYEERQQALISRDKALQIEIADLKKYISTGISAGGEFKDVKLDAVITDVKIGEQVKEESDWGTTTSKNTVTIYHNQNPIALAECEADDGNGGYYYSVGSLVIGKIHFPIVEA